MLVSELEPGMLVQPAGDNEIFVIWKGFGGMALPYLSVRIKKEHRVTRGSIPAPRCVMYLGTRKDVSVTKEDFSWSDRYVMSSGHVVAVDPSSWKRMKPVETKKELGG